jgi:site-specific recombinase XerD
VQGVHHGEPIDQSLGTRALQEALRQVELLEDPHAPLLKPVEEAVAAYKKHILPLAANTQRRYGHVLHRLAQYCAEEKLRYLTDVEVEVLDDYRSTRQVAPSTNAKELVILRIFFAFARERQWIMDNPALRIQPPRNLKPTEIVPYTRQEITRILAACDGVRDCAYERQRARALILLMRYTGLRISDAAALERDRIKNGQIFLHTKKTGGMVFLPVPQQLEDALARVPAPRGAREDPRYYFWNEVSSRSTLVGSMERMLRTVFQRSGVKGAHAHKFRHTLATDLLARGYSEPQVADVLGISPAVVHRHYAKWSQARQESINEMMREYYAEAFEPEASPERVN